MTNSHKTAIPRKSLSAPARMLQKRNLIQGRVLDYGSGKSLDSKLLGGKKFDPHFSPKMPKGKFDTILMSFVLNTLKPTDRKKALASAVSKLKKDGKLFATVRTDKQNLKGTTSRGTFQTLVKMPYSVVGSGNGYKTYQIER